MSLDDDFMVKDIVTDNGDGTYTHKIEFETWRVTIPMNQLIDSIPEEEELCRLVELYNSFIPKFYGLHRL
jgi:hypothetical protein